jgi:hypothetical protein
MLPKENGGDNPWQIVKTYQMLLKVTSVVEIPIEALGILRFKSLFYYYYRGLAHNA